MVCAVAEMLFLAAPFNAISGVLVVGDASSVVSSNRRAHFPDVVGVERDAKEKQL